MEHLRITKRLRATAYHEVGHAVMDYVLNRRFRAISIIPNEQSLGRVEVNKRDSRWLNGLFEDYIGTGTIRDRFGHSVDVSEAYILMHFGAVHAQAIVTGQATVEAACCSMDGIDVALSACGLASDVTNAYINYLWLRAKHLINGPPYRPAVDALASALLQRKRIEYREAVQIIEDAAFPGLREGLSHLK
jgi:hypothetical protein